MRSSAASLLLVACAPEAPSPLLAQDEAVSFVTDPAYARAILERDLLDRANDYAALRLERYTHAWEFLPERDPRTRPFTVEDQERLLDGERLDLGAAAALAPETLPTTQADWVALGERVFLEHPMRHNSAFTVLAGLDADALDDVGMLRDGDRYVGLAVFEEDGEPRVGTTCALCHASFEEDGTLSGRLSNRAMDVGIARLRADLADDGTSSEVDNTDHADLERLGPGRNDVLDDDTFNPYAFPDWGGLGDMPYLHHNANWTNRGVATLAVRCETLFVTANDEESRIPRVLAWALAEYIVSLAAPEPLHEIDDPDAFEAGAAVFEAAGCSGCHVPPLYSSDLQVSIEQVGTDPSAGASPSRHTGLYRIPSLRGVGRTAPYLHHGALPDLESMFDPARTEPGHPWGLTLSAADREALLGYLERI